MATVVVVIDQWTKGLIQASLGPGGGQPRVSVAGDWFLIEYAQNRGVAFGAFAGRPELPLLLAVIVLSAVVAYAVHRDAAGWWLVIGAGLVVGGAVGNLLDRARLGYVIDFVAIGPWPNFNVADAAITAGVTCLVIDGLIRPGPGSQGIRETADG